MTLQTLFFLGLILVCPIAMILMMRGGGMMNSGTPDAGAAAHETRIADLEQEIERLKKATPVAVEPESIWAPR